MVFNFIMIAQLIAHEIAVIIITTNHCVLSVVWLDSTLSNSFETCVSKCVRFGLRVRHLDVLYP